MVLPFHFPAELDLGIAGPEEAKNPAGEKVLRLIRARLATLSLEKITPTSQDKPAMPIAASRSINGGQLFICTHNESVYGLPPLLL
jgi:hypothetical protein